MTAKEEKAIKFLSNLSQQLHRHDLRDIIPWLNEELKWIPFFALEKSDFSSPETPRIYRVPKALYRARENETYIPQKSTMNLPWKNIKDISHVPLDKPHLVKDYGRANIPNEPKFYCSNNYGTACIECLTKGFTVDKNESKTVTCSEWQIKEPLMLAQVAFSRNKLKEIKYLNPENFDRRIQFADNWYEDSYKKLENDPNRPCSMDYAMKILELFSDEFGKMNITSGRDYILSNYYSYRALKNTFNDGLGDFDGIIFPSVKYSYQEFNIVLQPKAMYKLSFKNACQVWVNYSAQTKQVNFNPMETAFSDESGNLKWNLFKH